MEKDTDGNQLILKNKYISYGDVSINFRNGEGSGSVDTTAGQQLFGINQRMEGYGKTVKAMVWEYANDELGTTNELMRIDQSGDLFVGGDITTSGTINYAKSVRVEEYYNGSLSTPRYYKLAQLPSPSASGNGDVHISGTLGTHTGNHSNINVNISTRDGLKFNGTLFGKNAYANDIYIDSSYGVWLRGYSYFLSNIVVSTTGSMTTLDYDGSYTTTAPSGLTKISNTTETGSWWAGSTTKNTF